MAKCYIQDIRSGEGILPLYKDAVNIFSSLRRLAWFYNYQWNIMQWKWVLLSIIYDQTLRI